MDAADDNRDVKLYRASGDLIPEIKAKLPKLVWHQRVQEAKPTRVRKWVIDSKTDEIIRRLDSFQEWPQLLDPHVMDIVQVLTDAFLAYVTSYTNCCLLVPRASQQSVSPLPRAVSKILSVLCKVRGQKIIVRLLPNEARHIEPLLNFVMIHDIYDEEAAQERRHNMVWEDRYVLFLWLSHLMLTPFDLSSVAVPTPSADQTPVMFEELPKIALAVTKLAFRYLDAPGKDREAACVLLVRLALRTDMQAQSVPEKLIKYAIRELEQPEKKSEITSYHHIGLLSLLFGILNLASDNDIATCLTMIFRYSIDITTGDLLHQRFIRNTAPCRKLLIKIIRSSLIHALSLAAKGSKPSSLDDLDTMLEEAIQYLLDALGDKDTPVRMAAAKNLSKISLNLDPAMSVEVIQAVLESFNENMLLEDLKTGTVIPMTDIAKDSIGIYRRNLSAVDPLKWHGLLLTLGHLLFRRAPSTEQLSDVIEALILGINFEQRSNVGTSVGVAVRDAACFGLWSVVRKYTTKELKNVEMPALDQLLPVMGTRTKSETIVQMIARELVISACLDPSGNIRRGCSAALQEMIGRHPDSIAHGITLVQAVDYHAVARRSWAMREVSVAAANLDVAYRESLLAGLTGWRGSRATDADSRREATPAICTMAQMLNTSDRQVLLTTIQDEVSGLKPSNVGSTAETRQGLLFALSALIDAYRFSNRVVKGKLVSLSKAEQLSAHRITSLPWQSESSSQIWSTLGTLVGNIQGRTTRDIELILEATATLITSLAQFHRHCEIALDPGCFNAPDNQNKTNVALEILDRCVTATDKDWVIEAAAGAAVAVFNIAESETKEFLIKKWTSPELRTKPEFRSRGRIHAVGMLYPLFAPLDKGDLELMACFYLKELVGTSWPIETRCCAMASITRVIASHKKPVDEQVCDWIPCILQGLMDHSVDQRGDVGSLLRLQSIEAVNALVSTHDTDFQQQPWLQQVTQEIVKLAAEKLGKVRFQAWMCLSKYWVKMDNFPDFPDYSIAHVADVSSSVYYRGLICLFKVVWLRKSLILGLTSSVAGGADDIGRASMDALVAFLQEQSKTDRMSICIDLLKFLLEQLATCGAQDDREAVPSLEFLAIVLEQQLAFSSNSWLGDDKSLDIWATMEKVHTPTVSIQRLEAILRVYCGLCNFGAYRIKALEKLTRLLLHRYPKIRGIAADVLFLHTEAAELISCDWIGPIPQFKPDVVKLRKRLGVSEVHATSVANFSTRLA